MTQLKIVNPRPENVYFVEDAQYLLKVTDIDDVRQAVVPVDTSWDGDLYRSERYQKSHRSVISKPPYGCEEKINVFDVKIKDPRTDAQSPMGFAGKHWEPRTRMLTNTECRSVMEHYDFAPNTTYVFCTKINNNNRVGGAPLFVKTNSNGSIESVYATAGVWIPLPARAIMVQFSDHHKREELKRTLDQAKECEQKARADVEIAKRNLEELKKELSIEL